MAVTPTTLTELNDLAKDFYSDVYLPQMNTDTPLRQQFSKLENAMFTGRKWIFGVKTSVGGASANAGANKTLPPADEGKYDQGEASLVRTYTRMSLDGLVIEVTKRRDGSYRPALAETMADRLTAHDLEVNRQMFCGGDGKLALVQTGANSTTQTLEKDYGVTNGGAGTRHLYEGDLVEAYSSDGSTKRAGGPFTVVTVNNDVNTVVLSAALNSTTADFITRATADTDNKTAGEANGLLVAVDDAGTFEAIPSATVKRWRSVVLSNSGALRDINNSLVMQLIVTIRSKSRKIPNLAVTRPGIVLKYSEIFLPLARLQGQDVQLKGGYKPISAIIHAGGSIPVLEDLDCPDSRLFLLHTESWRFADMVGTEWADMDGAQFDRVTDKDAIEGYIRKYWQLICVQRNANGVLEDLNDVSSIDRLAA